MQRLLAIGAVAASLAAAGCGDSGSSAPPMGDEPPTLSAFMNDSVQANSRDVAFDFSVDDDVTPPGDLSVSVESDNQSLVNGDGIAIDGSGGQRTLLLTPVGGQTGSTTIKVTVTDGLGQIAERAFRLTVVPQQVSFNSFVRDTFAAGPNGEPRSINDKEFDDDSVDFNDLAAQ